MVRQCIKDVWSCVLVEHGGLYLLLDGQERMIWLCVGNWVIDMKV